MKVLCVMANPKPIEESYSKRAGVEFIKEYKLQNPNHKVVIMDLYEKKQEHLSYDNLNNMMYGNFGKAYEEALYFSSFDKYIICAPMWNLSTPSILKSYIDYIVFKGISFKFRPNGIPKGLLNNKKAIYIGSRGGFYPFPFSLIVSDERYIRFIFRFMGIKDFKKIIFQNTDRNPVKAKENFPDFLDKVRNMSTKF